MLLVVTDADKVAGRTEGLTGEVNNQAQMNGGKVDDMSGTGLIDFVVDEVGLFALLCIRDNGDSISRKQLTVILVKKFGFRRQTVSTFILQWIRDKSLFEVNGFIQTSEDMALPF